jgi:hypothetical protein
MEAIRNDLNTNEEIARFNIFVEDFIVVAQVSDIAADLNKPLSAILKPTEARLFPRPLATPCS